MRLELGSERLDLGTERPDMRSKRLELGSWTPDLGSEIGGSEGLIMGLRFLIRDLQGLMVEPWSSK